MRTVQSRPRPSPAHAALTLWAALALALAAVGCGGGGGHAHSAASTATHSATGTSTSTTAAGLKPAIAPVDAVFDDGVYGQQVVRVTIYDLRRVGPFVQLDFSLKCVREPGSECSVDNILTRDQNHVTGTPDGVSLVDASGDVQYTPVTDGQGRVDGSQLPNLLAVAAKPQLAWVRFKAPPASVSSLEVLFPNAGPQISAVPLAASGSAPAAAQITGGATPATAAPFSQPLATPSTAGLTLPALPLTLSVGGRTGSDQQSGARTRVTLSSDVLFAFGKARLSPRAHAIIATVGGRLRSNAAGPVAIDGYTDSIGTDAVNVPLSRRRAAAVAAALRLVTGGGVDYRVAGHGSADPVAPNTTPNGTDDPAGRRLNRRVTIAYRVKVRHPPQAPPQAAAGSSSAGEGGSRSVTFRAVEPNVGTSTYAITAEQLYRVGNLVALRFTAQCQSASGSGGGCDGEFDFSGSTDNVPPLAANALGNHSLTTELDKASGVYLTDPSSGLSYAPASAGQGIATAGAATLTAGVNPNKFGTAPWPMWAYFPAPPAGVTSVNVVLPGGAATIKGVPISAAPPSP